MMNKSLSRRSFLKVLGQAGGGIFASQIIRPELLLAQSSADGSGKNMILINLLGGCDGLQLAPYFSGDLADAISELRPTLGVPRESILRPFSAQGVASQIGLHPATAPLFSSIAKYGRLIQKYGILNDLGRSHEQCQSVMDLGVSEITPSQKGFMAKFADELNFQLFQYWGFIDSSNSLSFNTERAVPLVVRNLENLNVSDLWSSWGDGDNRQVANTRQLLLEAEVEDDPVRQKYIKARSTVSQALLRIRSDIAVQSVGMNGAGNYDSTAFGLSLRDAAKVLKAKYQVAALGLEKKVSAISLAQGGYDHHSSLNDPESENNFSAVIGSLSKNLAVLIEDLKLIGAWEKTAIVVFSEFGRTPYENGTRGETSVGTDHGWGSSTFVLGGEVKPGVSGDYPTATELMDDDVNALLPTTDYREIFSEIFSWIGVEPKAIFDDVNYTPRKIGIF